MYQIIITCSTCITLSNDYWYERNSDNNCGLPPWKFYSYNYDVYIHTKIFSYKEDQPDVSPHPDPEVLAASAPYSQHTLHLPSRFFPPKTKARYNQKPNPSFVPIVDMMDTSMDGFNEANGDGNILNDVQAIESDYKQHQSINNNYSTTSPNSSKGIQKSGVSVKRKQIDSESHFFGRFVASKLSTVADPHIRTKVQMRIMKVFDDLPSHSYVNTQNQLLELDECYDNDGF